MTTSRDILAGRQNVILAHRSRKMKVEGDPTAALDALRFQKLV